MPGHFDGPAPTIAPTLYDEDLPWLGFHFDTKQVMFKKIEDDSPGKMPLRMAPSKSLIKLATFDKKCQISPSVITKGIVDVNARWQYLMKKYQILPQ